MSPIVISPQVAGALRILQGSGVSVSIGQTSGEMTPEQLAEIIEEVQRTIIAGAQPKLGVPLWDIVGQEKGNASDGFPGGADVQFSLTSSLRLYGQGFIPRHTFQDQGCILIQAGVIVNDTAGASQVPPDLTAAILSRNDYDIGAGSDEDERGKVDASPVTHLTVGVVPGDYAVPTFADGAGQRFTLTMFINAGGNDGSGWNYTARGSFDMAFDPSTSASEPFTFVAPFSPRFDPTEHKLLELHLSAPSMSGTQTVKLDYSRASFIHFKHGMGLD